VAVRPARRRHSRDHVVYVSSALPERPGALLAGLRGGPLLLTEDGGESWTRLAPVLPDVIDMAAASMP
jgi:hypothetical protein